MVRHSNPQAPSWYKKLHHDVKATHSPTGRPVKRTEDGEETVNIRNEETENIQQNGHVAESEAHSSREIDSVRRLSEIREPNVQKEKRESKSQSLRLTIPERPEHGASSPVSPMSPVRSLLDPPVIQKQKSFMQIQHEIALEKSQGIIRGWYFSDSFYSLKM